MSRIEMVGKVCETFIFISECQSAHYKFYYLSLVLFSVKPEVIYAPKSNKHLHWSKCFNITLALPTLLRKSLRRSLNL